MNETHNEPRPKTIMSAYFCRLGSCRFFSTGMGYIKIRISVTMWIPALENQRAVLSKHHPGVSGSQNFCTGTQVNQPVMNENVP